jgi:adenylosuccinate synthase
VSHTQPNVTAIVGAQWGDEGKGKITDFFADGSDYVVRFHGGNNAGHTVIVGEETYKLHLIPSGVLYPHPVSIIGNGVVINPAALLEEIRYLRNRKIEPNLKISDRAHVIMPYHIAMDEALTNHQGSLAAGSTKRGIAPVYADKMYRQGIRMIDLLDASILQEKLEKAYRFNQQILTQVLGASLDQSLDEILHEYLNFGQKLKPYIADVSILLYRALKDGKSILFEGAQGTSLDVDHGIYPHTTSSNTVAGNISAGSGVGIRHLGRVIGVAKAYVSRVGISPFPTELPESSAKKLRDKGHEYGTTTGRPRRVGWLDLVQLRQAVRVHGLTEIALTKLDIMSEFNEIPVCVSYKVNHDEIKEMPASLSAYRQAKPVYKILPGWGHLDEDLHEKSFSDLPSNLRHYIHFIEERVQCPVTIISMGPKRHQTLLR